MGTGSTLGGSLNFEGCNRSDGRTKTEVGLEEVSVKWGEDTSEG